MRNDGDGRGPTQCDVGSAPDGYPPAIMELPHAIQPAVVAKPIEIIERLRTEIAAALAHPSTQERLSSLGIELKGSTRDELRSFMRAEVDRWGAIARKAGVTPE